MPPCWVRDALMASRSESTERFAAGRLNLPAPMNSTALRLPRLGLGGLMVLAIGCSGGVGSLSGKVTYQDKPVIYGTVKVRCPSGIEKIGDIKPDGSYLIPDIPVGPVKIAVISPQPPDPKTMARRGDRPGATRAPEIEIDRSQWRKLPEDVGDPERSGLATTISGATQFDVRIP